MTRAGRPATWRRVGVLPGARPTGRGRAAGLLLALAALISWGLATLPRGIGSSPTDEYGDVDLYREIAAGVAAGGNYYTVALQTQLAHDFPTSPFTAVRLPTLTFVQNALGESGAGLLLIVLTALALLAMTVWMRRAGVLRAELLAAVLILGANLALAAVDGLSWFHDAWAGVLIVLAIALRSSKAWWLAVAVGFAAVCFRELALPFLLVMVVVAWPRRREAVVWGAAIVAFAGVCVLHALAVTAAQPAVPVQSSGWIDLGGWPFIVASTRFSSLLALAPAAVAAVCVPLALFGWFFAPVALRAVPLVCAAFIACFLVVGRPDNAYWGLLYAAPLLTGLAFAPRGLVASVRTAIGSSAQA